MKRIPETLRCATAAALLAMTTVVLFAAPSDVRAQTKLSRGQVVTSLRGLDPVARRLNISQLRQRIIDGIKADKREPDMNRPPVSAQMAQLRQFSLEITFNLDSAIIRPQSYYTVGLIADSLHHPVLLQYRFLIVGHTDAQGDRMYNYKLSERRAAAVRNALIGVFRVPPRRLLALGMGEEQLRDRTKPNSIINRRVQLINIGE